MVTICISSISAYLWVWSLTSDSNLGPSGMARLGALAVKNENSNQLNLSMNGWVVAKTTQTHILPMGA